MNKDKKGKTKMVCKKGGKSETPAKDTFDTFLAGKSNTPSMKSGEVRTKTTEAKIAKDKENAKPEPGKKGVNPFAKKK